MIIDKKKLKVYKALSNIWRVTILQKLYDGPLLVKDIKEGLNITSANLGQHLKVLVKAKLVSFKGETNKRIYKLREGNK